MTSNLKVFISMTSLVSGNLCKMVCSTLHVSTLIGSYTKPKIPKIRQPQSYIDVHMSPPMFFLLLSYSRNHENIINSIMYIAYNIQACTLLTYILQITNYAVYQQIFQIQGTNLKCYIYISLFLPNLIGVTTKYLARVQLTSDAIG